MLISILAIIFGIGLMITFHEFGHFIAAKKIGILVEEFAIGFKPKLLSKKIGETEYIIGLIPLGGYCKMAGEEKSSGNPREFMSRKLWERIVVIVAGPFLNIILAVLLFYIIGLFWGESVLSDNTIIGQVLKDKPAQTAGLQRGDRIISINGKQVQYYDQIKSIVEKSETLIIEYEREKKAYELSFDTYNEDGRYYMGIGPYIPPILDHLSNKEPTYTAGLRNGDLILSINGNEIYNTYDISDIFEDAYGDPIKVEYERDGKIFSAVITPEKSKELTEKNKFEEFWNYGLMFHDPKIKKNVLTAFTYSMRNTYFSVFLIYTSLKLIMQKFSNLEYLGGPIAVGYIFSKSIKHGFDKFLWIVGIISINLAFVNLIPLFFITDGGLILIFLIEAIIGKKFSDKARQILANIGIAMILVLFIFVFWNDIMRFIR